MKKNSQINYKKLKTEIKNIHWREFYDMVCTESKANFLVQEITACIHRSTQKRKDIIKKRKNWITAGLINSKNKKNEMYKRYRENIYDQEIKTQFIEYRNYLHKLIKQTKFNYYRNKIPKHKNCPKNLWNTIEEIKHMDNKQKIETVLNERMELINTPEEIAN